VEDVASKAAALGLEAEPVGSEAGSVELSDPHDNVDPDDAATRKQPAWWETARARKQVREARILASQASSSPTAASDLVDQASRTGSVPMPAFGTESEWPSAAAGSGVESPIALARRQQLEESRGNYERGRR
jgi:hypothetical protein